MATSPFTAITRPRNTRSRSGKRAAAVLEGEREHAPARPRPVLHELVEPRALERAVHEDVFVPLELRVVTVVVDAVGVVRRGAEEEELRAARALHERRQRVAGLHVFDEPIRPHRAIRWPRTIATTSPAWFVYVVSVVISTNGPEPPVFSSSEASRVSAVSVSPGCTAARYSHSSPP